MSGDRETSIRELLGRLHHSAPSVEVEPAGGGAIVVYLRHGASTSAMVTALMTCEPTLALESVTVGRVPGEAALLFVPAAALLGLAP
jgi:hypothetical protein